MNPQALKYRKILAGAFFGTLVPLIYYFIQHKVHKVPGGSPRSQSISLCPPLSSLIFPSPSFSLTFLFLVLPALIIAYTIYAFFEWSLVLLDVGFDAVSVLDFDKFEFQVIEKGLKDNEGSASSRPYYSAV
jgi:hypothetical protein